MELFSFLFLSFVIASLIVHEIVGKIAPNKQWIVRLVASLCFYAYLAKFRILFIALSALSIWGGALIIKSIGDKGKALRKAEGLSKEEKKEIKAATQRKKRIVLSLVLAFNLGILAFVKYVMPTVSHSIVLPLGISFYTFQAIAYMVDVYGDKYAPQSNYAKILLYLSWFPQLIQGPINRYDLVEKDLYKPCRLSWDTAKVAFILFLFGAIKRYTVGDALAGYVEEILGGEVAALPGSYLLFGAFLFAIEQYANFSGGIDMVMAVSMLFGVQMMENFKQPYFSKSLSEFWRRWHISLGAFMRDYVFYPFAMSKSVQKLMKKSGQKFGNHFSRSLTGGLGNILVFALVGLWHGPEKHYLAWGLYNGFIIATSDALAPLFGKLKGLLHIKDESKIYNGFCMLRTFMIIVLAGYFDVVNSVTRGIQCFVNTFVHFRAAEFNGLIVTLFEDGYDKLFIALIGVLIILIVSILRECKKSPLDIVYKRNIVVRWAFIYIMIFFFLYSLSVVGSSGGFMYAAF